MNLKQMEMKRRLKGELEGAGAREKNYRPGGKRGRPQTFSPV